ncbi:MAG TPA: septum formation family protein [Beutenbergiaceae bacterium]|nr:septum formation family protein [Beutenbergiaceae bacterium]
MTQPPQPPDHQPGQSAHPVPPWNPPGPQGQQQVPLPQAPAPGPQTPMGQSPYGLRSEPAPPQHTGQYGQFTFPQLQKAKLEPTAVAGIATSIFGIPAIILGLMARPRVRGGRRRSPALAWTSISLGALFTIAWILVAVSLTLSGTIDRITERPIAGDTEETRTVAAANLAEGNCVERLPPANEVGEVRVVPCAQAHIAQVLAVHTLDGAYPGAEELEAIAQDRCSAELDGLGETEVAVDRWYFMPSETGWDQGNTQVVCLVRGAQGPYEGDLVN